MKINLRRIKKEDNKQLKDILIEVLNEFEVPEEGTALGDDELNYMFESYSKKRHISVSYTHLTLPTICSV